MAEPYGLQLKLETGPRRGISYPISAESVTLGRGPSADICLPDSSLLPQHVRLEVNSQAGLIVQGYGPVLHNGREIEKAILKAGDMISLGHSDILVAVTTEQLDGQRVTDLALRELLGRLKLPAKQKLSSLSLDLQSSGAASYLSVADYFHQIARLTIAEYGLSEMIFVGWDDGFESLPSTYSVTNEATTQPKAASAFIECAEVTIKSQIQTRAIVGPKEFLFTPVVPNGTSIFALAYPTPPNRRREEWEALGLLLGLGLERFANTQTLISIQENLSGLIQSMEEQLEHHDKLTTLGNLAGALAHDLKTPLSGILGFVELAQRHAATVEDPRKLISYLDRAYEAAEYCCAMSRNVLAFASEPDGVKHEESFQVKRAVQRAISICQFHRTFGEVKVTIEIPEEHKIAGSASALQQIIVNLVTNACDALVEMGRTDGEVVVRSVENGEDLILEVADNGPGIPESMLDEIFQPLYSTKKAGEGTGLGLYIVDCLAREAGGRIDVSSSSLGTQFSITLPGKIEALSSESKVFLQKVSREG